MRVFVGLDVFVTVGGIPVAVFVKGGLVMVGVADSLPGIIEGIGFGLHDNKR
jgi:hypothetical protein